MEDLARVFRRNLLEKLSRSSLGVATCPEVHGQKWGLLGGKTLIFESLDSHVEQPDFSFLFFPVETRSSRMFSSVCKPIPDLSGILPDAAFRAREVPAASDLTFSYSAAGTSGGEPQKGTAGFKTHCLDPDKMRQGK